MSGAERGFVLETTAYLGLAAQSLLRRSMLVPAILLALALAATNIVALHYPPVRGSSSLVVYSLTLLVRIAAVLILSVAILRLAADSPRRSWMPDGAFWLYALLIILIGLVPTQLKIMLGDIDSLRTGLLTSAADIFLVSFFAPWLVAAAAERPIAWRPANWLRRFEHWFLPRLLWALLLIVPLVVLQLQLPPGQFIGTSWFWPTVIANSLLGFLILMIRLGLDVAAYRRVAQQ